MSIFKVPLRLVYFIRVGSEKIISLCIAKNFTETRWVDVIKLNVSKDGKILACMCDRRMEEVLRSI